MFMQMTDFKILESTEIDLIVGMMEDFYAIDNYTIDSAVSKRNFELFIGDPKLGQAFLIISDGEIAGYIIIVYFFSFEFQGKVAILDELYIRKEHRGKGLGKSGVQFAQDFATEQKCKLMFLEVEPHNEPAKKLYHSEGFALHPRQLMRRKLTL